MSEAKKPITKTKQKIPENCVFVVMNSFVGYGGGEENHLKTKEFSLLEEKQDSNEESVEFT